MLLTLLALAFAGVALGSGLDRLSETAPPLERLVPGLLRAQSDRTASAVALVRNQREVAEVAARRALDADPIDPRPAALLGATRLLGRDYPGAEAAFRVAARFGWREPLTQLYWFEAALESGDYPRAAERLDALLRVNPGFPEADAMLASLGATPAGRDMLARRLAGAPAWRDQFLVPPRDAGLDLLRQRAEVAVIAAGRGGRFGCSAPRLLVGGLLAAGDRASAARLWNAHCPGQPAGEGLTDGGFGQLAASDTDNPFGWARRPRGDLLLRFGGTAGDPALVARNGASVSVLLVSQPVAFAPGSYVLRGEIREGTQPARGRIAASFNCGAEVDLPVDVFGDPATDGQAIRVPPCAQQQLGLWLRPGAGEVTIDDVRFVPAR